jgi:hypothetical protein
MARESSSKADSTIETPAAKAGIGLFVTLAVIALLLWGFAALADGFNEDEILKLAFRLRALRLCWNSSPEARGAFRAVTR